ncbi:hypothetical protein [Ferviditalea candida]|uniref:Uncharacterized protein n=1 Tax=Ferviditalea candida TaxID=3108399 RepID=A0ABU5ZI77_9BACL|nr:hypothetical protein [Paenibacillaceae bacterium T2]
MFDPTIYENLKVVMEGAVYDLDLSGEINIVERSDLIDLATMSRTYRIGFRETKGNGESKGQALAFLQLHADMEDLAAEILEQDRASFSAGCRLTLFFETIVRDISADCRRINEMLTAAWGDRPVILQSLSFDYPSEKEQCYRNRITIDFGRKIDERQIGDFPRLLEFMRQSLQSLELT